MNRKIHILKKLFFTLTIFSFLVLTIASTNTVFASDCCARGNIDGYNSGNSGGVPVTNETLEPDIFVMAGEDINLQIDRSITLSKENEILNLTPEEEIEDTTPPVVSSVYPADGATDVPINQDRITVRFNEDMDRQSLIQGGTIYFTDSAGNMMGVNFRLWFDDGLQLQFYYLLEPNSTYYVHVTTNATDLAGNHLEEEYVSSFTTINPPSDNEPPVVSSVSPADGATDVSINQDRITVRFNEDMDRQSLIQGGTIYFTDSAGNMMGVNFRLWFDDGLQLQFYYLLEPNSTYYVHVTTNATDLAGNHLEEEYVSSFTTINPPSDNEPPVVSSVSPADGATDVPINQDRITVRFNEDMDRQSLIQGGTIYFTDSAGNMMGVNFRLWFDDGLQLQFYYLLEANSTYYVHVTTNATDLAGNHLEEEYVSSFTTESLNQPPVADANGPYIGSVGSSIIFDASGSYDPDGEIVLYEWDFENDGIYEVSSTTPSATHAYGAGFMGLVGLRVTDNEGLSDTDTTSVEITNQPPDAHCQDVTQPTIIGVCSASASVNDGSFDPDGDPVTLDQYPPGPYGLGATEVTLTVTDDKGATDTCIASITVVDQEPPITNCPAPQVEECTGPDGAAVVLSASATDNCTGNPSIVCDAASGSLFPFGSTTVACTATDESGNSGSCDFSVTVQDTLSPVISSVSTSPDTLWPPNHRVWPVTITAIASDNCDPTPVCQIVSVESNEPVDDFGYGDTAPDWEITGDLTVDLRAERSGQGHGRVYTITVECTDNAGKSATAQATVIVPHDKGKNKNKKKK